MNLLREKQKLQPYGNPMMDGGGGGGGAATQTQVSDVPDWAKPYAKEILGKTNALTDISQNPYQQYTGERTARFSPLQEQAFSRVGNMQAPGQTRDATNITQEAANRALNAQYQPSQSGYMGVNAPQLQQYQMGPAERATTQSFTQPGSAEAYMNPFMQNVVDKQTREAERQSGLASKQARAQSIQRGAFGGAGTAIREAASARDLSQLKSDIYGTGQQAAYQNAQQQFNTEQQSRMQAQLANQQAGLTVGGQNLNAQLGIQQLGAGQNMQSQLANQQAFQNMQQQREQSRQFGANYGLQGLQAATQGAAQLGNLGQQQFNQQRDIAGMQQQFGTQQQQQRQQMLNQQYQDFLNQERYPYQQMEFMSSMLRGTPIGTVNSLYQAPPSAMSQVAGLGLAGAGAYNLANKAEGGAIQENTRAGLNELALMRMGA
jgi:hypothetical protein